MATVAPSSLETARRLRRPVACLDDFEICPEALRLVPPSLARKRLVLPLVKVRDRVLLACGADQAVVNEDYFSKYLNCLIMPVLVDEEELKTAVVNHYGQTVEELTDLASRSVKRYQQAGSSKSKAETPVALLVEHTLR